MLKMNDLEKHLKNFQYSETSEYTFENFIVSESNKCAYDAAFAVAEGKNNRRYNPLHIYGQSDLGKTHLLSAIRNMVKQKTPERKVIYIEGDDFLDDLISHNQQKKIDNFREKYCFTDILLIDNIEFLEGMRKTQHELLGIYNTLREQDKQIVLTSEKSISDLYYIADTLRTRFISGIQLQILPPDRALREAIVKQTAKSLDAVLPTSVTHIENNDGDFL
jgi:chromosomal replication initiator protein